MPLNNDMAIISKHAQFIRSDFFRGQWHWGAHRTQGRRTRTLANIKDVSSSHLPLTLLSSGDQ